MAKRRKGKLKGKAKAAFVRRMKAGKRKAATKRKRRRSRR